MLIPELSYERRLKECGVTTPRTRPLRGDHKEVFKILNDYETILRTICSHFYEDWREHEITVVTDRCR